MREYKGKTMCSGFGLDSCFTCLRHKLHLEPKEEGNYSYTSSSECVKNEGYGFIFTLKIPKELHTLVCSVCGGTNILKLAMVDTNTGQYFMDSWIKGKDWCNDCENHTKQITKEEYLKQDKEE